MALLKKIIIYLPILLFVFSANLQAENTYQGKIGASYNQSNYADTVISEDESATLTNLNGEYYFSPVKLDNFPYEEAYFLQHIGSVRADLAQLDHSFSSVDFDFSNITQIYDFSATYMSTDNPLYLSGSLSQGKTKSKVTSRLTGSNVFNSSTKISGYKASLGLFLQDDFLIGVRSGSIDFEFSTDGFPDTDSQLTEKSLFTKYVYANNSEQSFTVNLEVQNEEWDDGDKSSATDIALKYFFIKEFGIGVGAASTTGDVSEGNYSNLIATYYISPKISVEASASKFLPKDSLNPDVTSYGASLAARF